MGTTSKQMQRMRKPSSVSASFATITALNIRETSFRSSRTTAIDRVAVRLNPYSVKVTKYQMNVCAYAIMPKCSVDSTRDRYGSAISGKR